MTQTQKIVKYVFLSFVFVFSVGVVFIGMQWFSLSLLALLVGHGNVLKGNLSASIADATNSEAQASQPLQQSIPETPPASLSPAPLPPPAPLAIPAPKIFQAEAGFSIQVTPLTTIVLFSKNPDEKLPIASLTKLMTAMVVLDNYDLSKNITVSQAAMDQEGAQGVLQLGQTLSVENLLYVALVESSNRAAYALAEGMGVGPFIATMNMDAQKLGLTNTHFADATGLDATSYSTARDVATLSEYLYRHYPIVREIIGRKTFDVYMADGLFHHTAKTTNDLLGSDNIIGGKTGFTNEAKGCFMTVQSDSQNGGYHINVLLGSPDRSTDMKYIISNF